ncbi:DNA cytosine methyltransferase [Mycoplasmopsis felis]|uniref:DNA cytosine methyltransferase n=1 Tax=Mycoplasmopsis felis TaxID=33923 RepID=UPI002AFFFE31|nr:DNA cytosine methyltransferase [Mycoplasmopsis felis]WQQ04000.1 DNA cytosine methyltransferase [Mycoplasmopsis felis]
MKKTRFLSSSCSYGASTYNIIGKYKRRITPKEARRLQSFSENFICNENDYQAYKQFGNAVNVKVIEYIAK